MFSFEVEGIGEGYGLVLRQRVLCYVCLVIYFILQIFQYSNVRWMLRLGIVRKKKILEIFIYFVDVIGDCRGQRIVLSKFEVLDWGFEVYEYDFLNVFNFLEEWCLMEWQYWFCQSKVSLDVLV